jgi:hypothetical protein
MRSGELHRDASRARDRAAPPAGASASAADLPPDAQSFLDEFYADDETRIRAGSPERLAIKIREVLDDGVRHADRAIVVLLKKLGDTSDGSAPGVTLAAETVAEERRDAQETGEDLERASAWLAEHPDVEGSIDARLEQDGLGPELDDDAIHRMSRGIARNAHLLAAWRTAGSPEVAHV